MVGHCGHPEAVARDKAAREHIEALHRRIGDEK
jgi:hypothetical protein